MVLKMIWRKTRLYKRFELDLWGMRFLYPTPEFKLARMFDAWDLERAEYRRLKRLRYIYRVDLDQPSRKFKRQKWRFVTRKVSRLFYLTLGYSQFRRLAVEASTKEGSWESNFIMLVENRVLGMVYRMQLYTNVFMLRFYVLLGNVIVSNKKVTYYNAAVAYFEIMRFDLRLGTLLRYEISKRFEARSMLFSIPRYLIISYKLMFAFVYKEPKRKDLTFPIRAIDVYRGADFY